MIIELFTDKQVIRCRKWGQNGGHLLGNQAFSGIFALLPAQGYQDGHQTHGCTAADSGGALQLCVKHQGVSGSLADRDGCDLRALNFPGE